jgi:hypothetical protein
MRIFITLSFLISQLSFASPSHNTYNIKCEAELKDHDSIFLYQLVGYGYFEDYKFFFSKLPTIHLSVFSTVLQKTTEIFDREALNYKREICDASKYCSLLSFTDKEFGSNLIYTFDDTSSSLGVRHYLKDHDVVKFSLGSCAFE